MRNLKRVLTMVMAIAMLMSLLVVGTSAANFSDDSKIVNAEAVDTMSALNIINGRTDGSFDPAGIVTRAEMAKMICVALNGGKDPQLGATANTFKDTKGHWAAGYIEYCYNLGIVSGRGDGNFDPNATVTGTEAAKMLLVTLGYDSKNEGFTGATWAIAVNVRANQKDFFEDLATMNPSAGLTRDNAAQMVYNAINAVKVEYEYKLTTVNGSLTTMSVVKDVAAGANDTIVKDKFNMVTAYTYLVGMSYDSKNKEYTYTYDSTGAGLPYAIAAADQLAGITLKSDIDYSSLMGQMVKVIYKNNTDKDVYGIYADSDSKVLASGVIGDIGTIKTDSFKFGGTVYKVDAATTAGTLIYSFRNTTANWAGMTVIGNIGTIPAAIEPYTMKMVDGDKDGKVDYLIAVPFTVAKVTYAGTTSITAGNVSYKFEDCNIASDLKKDDYAIITAAVNTAKDEDTLVKANVVTGVVKGIESATKITLDSTTYIADAGYTPPTFAMNDTFKLVVVNGYFFNASKQSTAAAKTNICLVTSQATTKNVINPTLDVQILLADGTKKVVEVEKVNTTSGGALGVVAAPGANNAITGNEVIVGQIYTYEVNSDGYYELSRVVAADYDAYATETAVTAGVGVDVANASTVTSVKDGKIVMPIAPAAGAPAAGAGGTYYFNDSAVVFYKTTGTTYKVTTGATANKWADILGITGIVYANKTNGYNKAEIALLNIGAAPDAGDTAYGWVTANPVLVKDGDDYYLQFKIWNGTSEVTVKADDYYNVAANGTWAGAFTSVSSATVASGLNNLLKGNPVSFIDNGNGFITNIQSFKGAQYAVAAYADGATDVALNAIPNGGATAATVTVETDTKIIFVDTVNNAGLTGGSITVANEPATGAYVKNCYALANASNEIKVIIVDTTNEVDGLASTITPIAGADGVDVFGTKIGATAPTPAAVTAMFTNAIGATVSATNAVVYAADGTAYTYTLVNPFNNVAITGANLTTALTFNANKTGAQIKTAADAVLTAANGVASYTVTVTAPAGVAGALADATTYTADLTLTFTITCANGEVVTIAGVIADVT